MVKKKQPTARIARKQKKTAVEEHFDDEGMIDEKAAPEETEEVVDASEIEALEEFQSDDPEVIDETIKDHDLDMFINNDNLASLDSADLMIAVKESSQKKKDVTEFIPEELQGKDLRQEVINLVQNISTNQFNLGRLLYYIDVNEIYKEWGYKTFSAYLNSNETGTRRLKYLVDLHKWLITEVKDSKKIEALKEIGWSKAKEIQRVATDASALDMWMDRAINMNLIDLTDAVRIEIEKIKVTEGNRPVDEIPDKKGASDDEKAKDDKENLKLWTCKLYPEEYELVSRMMDVAQRETKTTKEGRNLALVAQEFLMDADNNSGERLDNIKKYLKKIEERFDIRLIGIDNKTDKVFFGADLLDEV